MSLSTLVKIANAHYNDAFIVGDIVLVYVPTTYPDGKSGYVIEAVKNRTQLALVLGY